MFKFIINHYRIVVTILGVMYILLVAFLGDYLSVLFPNISKDIFIQSPILLALIILILKADDSSNKAIESGKKASEIIETLQKETHLSVEKIKDMRSLESRINKAFDNIKSLQTELTQTVANIDTVNLLAVGKAHYNQSEYAEAISTLNTLTRTNPTYPEGSYWLAQAYYKVKKFSLAKHHALAAVKLSPENGNYHGLVGELLKKLDDFSYVDHFEKAIEYNADRADSYFFQAADHISRKHPREAIKRFKELLNREPRNTSYNERFSLLCCKPDIQEFDLALKYLNIALNQKQNPNSKSTLYRSKARVRHALFLKDKNPADQKEAYKNIDLALSLAPNNIYNPYTKSDFLIRDTALLASETECRKNANEAVELLSGAKKMVYEDKHRLLAMFNNLLGIAYMILGKADLAELSIKEAIEIAPNNVNNHLTMMSVYVLQENWTIVMRESIKHSTPSVFSRYSPLYAYIYQIVSVLMSGQGIENIREEFNKLKNLLSNSPNFDPHRLEWKFINKSFEHQSNEKTKKILNSINSLLTNEMNARHFIDTLDKLMADAPA